MLSFSPGRLLTTLLLFVSIVGMQVPSLRCRACCPSLVLHRATSRASGAQSKAGCERSVSPLRPTQVSQVRINRAPPACGQPCPTPCLTAKLVSPDAVPAWLTTRLDRDNASLRHVGFRAPLRFASLRMLALTAPPIRSPQQGSPQAALRSKVSSALRI